MTAPRAKTTALARRILEIARHDGLAAGAHLAEVKLAERLGVSRSPVRAALALLKDLGAVKPAPGQGYFLALDSDGAAFAAVALPEPEEAVMYRDLVRARFANLIPSQVAVSDVMRRYDCDRAMANRVLAQMSEDGVIERAPGRGYLFGPVLNDAKAYDESYRFRLLVEPAAVLEPGFHPDPQRMKRLRAHHAALLQAGIEAVPMAELFEADADFHEAIGEFCGNRFLAHAIRLQTRLRRLSEYENYNDRDRLRDSCREHLAILDAFDAGDFKRAAVLLRDHIAVSQEVRPNFDKVRALAHRRLTRV
ncbi:MAG: FCD domain-containing protein [Kiloniellaceae bacterium]